MLEMAVFYNQIFPVLTTCPLFDTTKTTTDLEFPGWTDQDSIKTYISRVRDCLQDDQSKQALNEYLSQDALDMLYNKFVGRYRPAIVGRSFASLATTTNTMK